MTRTSKSKEFLLSPRFIGGVTLLGVAFLIVGGFAFAVLGDPGGRSVPLAQSLYQGIYVSAIAVAPVVVAFALVHRRRVARLDAAAGLVLWGLLIVVIEHVQFGRFGFGGANLRDHIGFHFQMLAAYGLAALALVGVLVAPLIRRGDAAGWLSLLVLVAIGVGAEVATAAITTPHGSPPRFWIAGLFLWGYPVAWGAALALSFRPIFRPEGRPAASVHRSSIRGA